MQDDLKYVESLEKEIDELKSNKVEFSNMYDILLQECVSIDVMCSYLHSLSDLDAHYTEAAELQCLTLHKVKEWIVHFGNDQFALIIGYGDLVQGIITLNRVYYVKGINHNLSLVGQFYDVDLEAAFRKSMCFARDLQGNDLLTEKQLQPHAILKIDLSSSRHMRKQHITSSMT
ncbi:hypothetical protein Tco_0040368 [Tanacetum coccineum]